MARVSTAFVVMAALCWGLSGGIGGMLMADGWDPLVVSFYRGAIGLVFVVVWLALRPHNSGLASRPLWFWSVIAGLGVAGNFTFYFVSIAKGSVAVAATLMYCAPVFVFLVSFALRLERPTTLKWAAIAMVILGIVLLTRIYDIQPGGVTPIGVAAGLLAGLSYAVFIFGFKYAAPHGSPQAILVMAFAVLAGILVWLGDADQTLAVLSASSWPLFALLGVLGAGVSFILYIVGLNHTAPAVAAIVAMVEPVTASLFGVVVLDERLVAIQLVGMGLILVTVTVLSVASSAR
ncbi:EamA family transporter [Halomonas cerina]|uniref:Drug/metabolite transporter (DMT)-like permease n=1 Tax=Halomonas cerina TaxID=447424 RepID=A0A839VJJ3_9GAMM|nr:DMT family transporter [Halomonas cerina]MBB3192556.1 drug/metabolite transporter (DMT)-like permease [Halomonas cerina]